MNKVEETVLIPKEEYEILLDKVNAMKDNDKEVVTDTPSEYESEAPQAAKEDVVQSVETDLSNRSAPSDTPSESVDALEKSKSSNESTPTKDSEKTDDTVQSEGGADRSELMGALLDKVTSNLKESVGLLAGYIIENGKGIIEWDKDLRFIHLKEVIPKTNMSKIMAFIVGGEEGKSPKGITPFKRSLKSIGLSDAKSWIFSQIGGMMSPYAPEKTKSVGKRSIDSIDGVNNDDEPKNKKLKKSSKDSKLKNLSTKWVSW